MAPLPPLRALGPTLLATRSQESECIWGVGHVLGFLCLHSTAKCRRCSIIAHESQNALETSVMCLAYFASTPRSGADTVLNVVTRIRMPLGHGTRLAIGPPPRTLGRQCSQLSLVSSRMNLGCGSRARQLTRQASAWVPTLASPCPGRDVTSGLRPLAPRRLPNLPGRNWSQFLRATGV